MSALGGRRILITAGPTREYLDPVRFISNPSSGKMGYALAAACRQKGAKVVLVSGPVALGAPKGVKRVTVTTARQMLEACREEFQRADAFIACAAVSDFRPAKSWKQKRKKTGKGETLRLVPNPDILRTLSKSKGSRVLIGFAAETEKLLAYAEKKLREKRLDLLVANSVAEGRGFGADLNQVWFLRPAREPQKFPLLTKRQVAQNIVSEIGSLLRANR